MYKSLRNELHSGLPDVALQTMPRSLAALDWVGMNAIQLPLTYKEQGVAQQVRASIGSFVNLVDLETRGIHMSRLYLLLEDMEDITPAVIHRTLRSFLDTHEGISTASRLDIAFDLMIKRPSLISDNAGWRFYPVLMSSILSDEGVHFDITCEVLYSSTCPCSKSLATHLVQDKFEQDFADQSTMDKDAVKRWLADNALYATPHSQRSKAIVTVGLAEVTDDFSLIQLTDIVEQSLRTPVQTVVKREDEQHFALLNGQNPMFCEDAARSIKQAVSERYSKYRLKVEHYESLHPHDAVAYASSD